MQSDKLQRCWQRRVFDSDATNTNAVDFDQKAEIDRAHSLHHMWHTQPELIDRSDKSNVSNRLGSGRYNEHM